MPSIRFILGFLGIEVELVLVYAQVEDTYFFENEIFFILSYLGDVVAEKTGVAQEVLVRYPCRDKCLHDLQMFLVWVCTMVLVVSESSTNPT